MAAVSAAIIVLASAIFVLAASLPSGMTEPSRQKLVGFGWIIGAAGAVAWIAAYVVALHRAL
jgi:hypothetical protein